MKKNRQLFKSIHLTHLIDNVHIIIIWLSSLSKKDV